MSKDIEFVTDKGARIKLVWEKRDYRAYIWKYGQWQKMGLGSGLPESLIEYIKENY